MSKTLSQYQIALPVACEVLIYSRDTFIKDQASDLHFRNGRESFVF